MLGLKSQHRAEEMSKIEAIIRNSKSSQEKICYKAKSQNRYADSGQSASRSDSDLKTRQGSVVERKRGQILSLEVKSFLQWCRIIECDSHRRKVCMRGGELERCMLL